MASDLSSEYTETIGVLDEKEEGEISLEDVSSSEEGHLNYGYGSRVPHCSNCLSTQHNATWCTAANKFYPNKGSNRREVDLILQDAVQGKENRHHIKDLGYNGAKHTASTLQEKNDDLVSISSDSDMEIVGLADNSKQIIIRTSSKNRVKKKRKKKRSHGTVLSIDDMVSSSTMDPAMTECVNMIKHDVKKIAVRTYHREVSPVHRNRTRGVRRSPPRRHRSLLRAGSPFSRSKSPNAHTRSPTTRRSPKRLKSPKRSPYRSSTKAMPRKTSHLELASSHNYVDTHKLLKKVRELDSIGTYSLEETLSKNKEHASSLKEKLTNMMKGVTDNNSDVSNLKEKSTSHVSKKESNDADDEEDLALLRQKALETKQNKSNKQNDTANSETVKQVSTNINDDQDEEDLELRMIALRSAVLKKHQNRVQKGIKSGKHNKSNISRSESPFTQSFLDSIPIPGEELLNLASPPHTPLPTNENNHTEDMELDTDVEREKEKLPYSPTDKITTHIPMDTELLGIQPSDVSFISLNEASCSPNFNVSISSSQSDQKSYPGKIIESRSYLPNIMYYVPSQNPLCPANTGLQYLPRHPPEVAKPDFMKVHNSHPGRHSATYEDTCSIPTNNSPTEFGDIRSSQEIPYSPTDTPVYDPDLSHALPQSCGPLTTSNSSLVSIESYASNMHGNTKQYNHLPASQHVPISKQLNNTNQDEQINKAESLLLDPVVGSSVTSLMESISPSSSMTTIDDLPEVDADTSPLTGSPRNMKAAGHVPRDSQNIGSEKDAALEPLYMKGIPDVTKDANKVPTLINRVLVPVPILKTNKQLQVPLPQKKCMAQQEPAFRSAEMQPVVVDEESNTKMNASFKPIKLSSLPQKSHSVLTIPTAFHDSLHEDPSKDTPADNDRSSVVERNYGVPVVENNMAVRNSEAASDLKCSMQKKKRPSKKGFKRKSVDSVMPTPENNNTMDPNNDKQQETLNEVNNLGAVETAINANDISIPSSGLGEPENVSLAIGEQELKASDSLCNDTSEQVSSMKNRRQSLDEDEEALRAILLASLPKRAKTNVSKSDTVATASVPNTVPIPSAVPTVSNPVKTLTQASVNQDTPKAVSNTVKVTNATSTEGSTFLSSPRNNVHAVENGKGHPEKLYIGAEKISAVVQVASPSAETVKALNVTALERKRSVPITRGPPKKLVKRISIPASTKVVNNAKRYQNTMIQKKLNLQKATLYQKQKIAENKGVLPKLLQSYDVKRASNTGKSLSETQRIVINLESDTESDSEPERQRNASATTAATTSNSVIVERCRSTLNSTVDFEKNLDQFLRAVRKKQESMAAARPTKLSQTPKKDAVSSTSEKPSSSNLHTPLAVRHLPASQQEEYRRLKQQILEREKLKLHRSIEGNSLTKNKTVEACTKSPSSGAGNPSKELDARSASQTVAARNQNANPKIQSSEDNSAKNSDAIKSASAFLTDNANRAKTIPRPATSNLDPRVSIESNPIDDGSKLPSAENCTRSGPGTPKHGGLSSTKTSPGLKVLSTAEVSRKYVQVQVKSDTNERMVTRNDKVTLTDKTVISRDNDISEICKDDDSSDSRCIPSVNGANENVQCIEENVVKGNVASSTNSDPVDSDASTIILPRENQNLERDASFDTTESTIPLSQYHEDSQVSLISLISNVESKDDGHFLLLKNNVSPRSTRSIEENWDEIKKNVRTELNDLINLPRAEQEQRLMDTEQKLVMKRYTILDDLAEMSSNLRQWHMERDLQTNLAAEVKKLREQLKVAEERLQVQRNRINSIGPKVVAAHGKINAGRQECFKLATICSTLGSRVVGKEYKVPEAGAQLLDSRLKEVANHTRQLSRKKVPSIDITETYESSKFEEEETAATMSMEISRTEDLLTEQCNVDNIDATILNENESSLFESHEVETTFVETTLETVHEEADMRRSTESAVNADTEQGMQGRTVNVDTQKSVQESTVNVDTQKSTQESAVNADTQKNVQESTVNGDTSSDNNEMCPPKQSNIKQEEVSSEETIPNDTHIPNSGGSNDSRGTSDGKQGPEDNMVRTTTVDAGEERIRCMRINEEEAPLKRSLLPYESILTHFKVSRNTNPNGILCPYELMGTCSDGDCRFVHQTENQAK